MSIEINGVELLKLDTPTINGRVYSRETIESALKGANPEIFGEFVNSTKVNGAIDLHNISHVVKNIRIDGSNLLGDITILDTPKGKTLQLIVSDMVPHKFAPSGWGEIHPDGTVTNFTFRSIDVVGG